MVPKQLRKPILELAHQIPVAGHLWKEKTAKRILQRFYWPTVFRDVKEHCQACTSCQKSSARKVHPAPMIPLPVISEPFHINMLKKWHVQPETAFSVQDLPEVDHEDEVQVWNCKETGSEDMPKINGDLTHIQCQEIQALLEEFPDVLSAKPGRTALTKHTIN